jgi:hypothetical protein
MSYAQYRLYFDNVAATKDQLAHFEDITIEQEMDMACRGRFQVPLCLSKTGVWNGETETFLLGLHRIRLEVQIQSVAWVPLIDGPIINVEGGQFNEPGKSMLTLVVSDDSFYLHRDETVKSFQDSDDEVARQIYNEVSQIADTDIDEAPAPSSPAFDTTVLRGTQMELLRQLARRQHMHAYVRCGDSPGESVGCFKADPSPTKDYGLAPMVLLGDGQNIFSFHSQKHAGQTATFRSGWINLKDRSTDNRNSNLSDLTLQGSDPTTDSPVKRLLRARQVEAMTLNRALQAETERAAYALKATGEVMKGVYTSVLQPYRNVQVLGANGTLSGTWLIKQVTHTLTRNHYGQSFHVIRNAQSAGTNNPPEQKPAEVFG